MHEIKHLVGSGPKFSPSINFQIFFFFEENININPLSAAQCYLIDSALPSGTQRSLLSGSFPGPERRSMERDEEQGWKGLFRELVHREGQV